MWYVCRIRKRRGARSQSPSMRPDPGVTPQVLQVLARHGAKATFFCIGERAARHADLCRAIVAAGHDVENHGQRHPTTASLMGVRGWHAEIEVAQETLASITGLRQRLYRAVAAAQSFPRSGAAPAGPAPRDLVGPWLRHPLPGTSQGAGAPAGALRPGAILLLHDGHAARTSRGPP